MNELLISTTAAAFVSIITFLLTRRKYKSEVKQVNAQAEGLEIDNTEKVVKIYRELTDDLRKELTMKIESLKSENLEMKEELQQIQGQYSAVLKENKSLREQMAALEKDLKSSRCQIKALSDQNKHLLDELKKFNQKYTEDQK